METIEQLKQDNAKLQERLNNAAKFFREQKAQIESLTKEKEELENRFKEQEAFETKTINKIVPELEDTNKNLNKQLNEYELKLQNSEQAYEELQKKYTEVKLLSDDSIQAGVELGKEIAELQAKIHQMENNSISQKDFDDEIKRLNQTISECKKSYDERVEDISKLQMQVVKLEKDNAVLIKSVEQYKAAYAEVKSKVKEYDYSRKNAEESYEQLRKKYEARKQQIVELMGSQAANVETIKNEYELKLQKLEGDYKDLQKVYEDEQSEYENKITSLKDDIKTLNGDIIKQNQEIEKLQIEKSDLEVNINDLTNRLSESINGKTKYQEFTEMIINLVDSFNNNGNNIDTDKHSSITINTYKNSTGNQFMSDAPGMNI